MNDPILARLSAWVRDVTDFPRPGILFKDFTPLLADPRALALAVELMANPHRGQGIQAVVGAESRGFIFGIAIAQALSAGFVPVRKPGKLPRPVHRVEYALEYGTDVLEIREDALTPGTRILLVDDLLATGGTLDACGQLVKRTGAEIAGITVLIELKALGGRARASRYGDVHAVLEY